MEKVKATKVVTKNWFFKKVIKISHKWLKINNHKQHVNSSRQFGI